MRFSEIILTLGAVGVALAVGEVVARKMLPMPYKVSNKRLPNARGMPRLSVDPEIGWVNEPSTDSYHYLVTSKTGSSEAVYHMRDGLRLSAPQPGPPPDAPVIVAAGCSFTYGLGINDSDTWPWMAQEQLAGYRLANLGTMNYGVGQSLVTADRFIATSTAPVKAVIYALADFHITRDMAGQRELWATYPAGRPRFLRSGDEVKNYGLVYFLAPGLFLERSSLLMQVLNQGAEIYNRTPSEGEAREISLRLIQQYAKRWKEQKIAFGIVVLPWGDEKAARPSAIRDFILRRLKATDIPLLTPEFPRKPDGGLDHDRFLIRSDDFHPNRDYNLILSAAITNFLKTEVLASHP